MKVYNARVLTRNQRFMKALCYGIPTALGCAVVLGILMRILPIRFEIMYLAVGYAIAYVIKTFGRGVQKKFSILAAILTFISLFLADCISIGGMMFFHPAIMLIVLETYVGFTSAWSLFGLVFRIGAIYTSYVNSRFI